MSSPDNGPNPAGQEFVAHPVDFESLDHSSVRPATHLQDASVERLHDQGIDTKHRATARIGDREVSLISRPYRDRDLLTWQAMREAGLPVVPTMRLATVEGRDTLLITDLEADGSELYGKDLDTALASHERIQPARPEIDEHFLELTDPSNISQVEQQALAYRDLATSRNIRLPDDDAFELRIAPDGKWELIILDLRQAMPPVMGPLNDDELAEISIKNRNATEDFLSDIRDIRERLLR